MTSTSAHGDLTHAPTQDWDRIEAEPEYRELRAMQRSFMVPATAVYLLAYFGFLLLAGLAPDFLGNSVVGSINLGWVLMVGLYVLVWVLVRLYMRIARDRWDPQAEKVAAGVAPATERYARTAARDVSDAPAEREEAGR